VAAPREPATAAAPELDAGRVVASHGRQLVVETESGERVPCRLQGRKLSAVCGDAVRFGLPPQGETCGTVHAILPRQHVLERVSSSGRAEAVVANLTQLIAVVAPLPEPDWFVVDHYLAAAAWAGVTALIAFNKAELEAPATAAAELAAFLSIGYPIVNCSTRAAPGIGTLAARLVGATSVLVGQSGTGKSSLLNALVPEARAVTQEISAATEQGRHTTSHAVLHRLASGGDLIDSPGVRGYAPPLPEARSIASGFAEIAAAASGCRFSDCLHDAEPGCAVREAVAAGRVGARRYESFRRLVGLTLEFAVRYPERRPRRGPSRFK
jgi:ribosome biogenesis GTPase